MKPKICKCGEKAEYAVDCRIDKAGDLTVRLNYERLMRDVCEACLTKLKIILNRGVRK